MSVNSQTIRLGAAVLGLVLVVTLCTAFPARADVFNGSIVFGWVPNGTSELTPVAGGEFGFLDLSFFDRPFLGASELFVPGSEYGAVATVTNFGNGGAKFMLDIYIPSNANADGYLLTLKSLGDFNGSVKGFTSEEFAALFESITFISDSDTMGIEGANATLQQGVSPLSVSQSSELSLSIWFDAKLFGEHVQFVFDNGGNTMPFGAFSASIQETRSSEIPEPATLAILGLGLAGLGFVRSRKR
ncbi:MAG: PEP-CTERM sorting domain-containing protein [Planctomycetaceae bacterium]|nr:PEP-CTERM sorting domain-containing protein [Planctomycetaceae bacterium]